MTLLRILPPWVGGPSREVYVVFLVLVFGTGLFLIPLNAAACARLFFLLHPPGLAETDPVAVPRMHLWVIYACVLTNVIGAGGLVGAAFTFSLLRLP